MKSIRLTASGSPLEGEDLSEPRPGPTEVLIEVTAAGICRSDVHYRSGARPPPHLPLTLGHEVAGTIKMAGDEVDNPAQGDRVVMHYLVKCGTCPQCALGREQFCERGEMIGFSRDGGFSTHLLVPAENAFVLPENVDDEVGAIMMCSTATSLHALRQGQFTPGETVAVFGCGGLGMSAIKLARALGAAEIYAVDIDKRKLDFAESLGADPVRFENAGSIIADVALELVGLPETMQAAVACLAIQGRAVAVGITTDPFPLNSYSDLVGREAGIVGSNDHLASEIEELLALAAGDRLDLSDLVTAVIPLSAGAVNEAMDRLESFDGGVRTVIKPGST